MKIVEIDVDVLYKTLKYTPTVSIIVNRPLEEVIEDFTEKYQSLYSEVNSPDYDPYTDGERIWNNLSNWQYHFNGEKLQVYFEDPIDLQLAQTYAALRMSNYYDVVDVELDLTSLDILDVTYGVDEESVITWETLDKHIEKFI